MVRPCILLGVVIGAFGCSGAGDPHGPCPLVGGPPSAGAMFGGIDYQVVGGFSGQGDGTSLQIQPDGSFTRHTPQRGAEQGQLDPAALRDLIAAARSAQFPTLCMMYEAPGVADELVYQVSVRFDASVLIARASQGGEPPDRLEAVIDALRQIVDRPLP
jgi:hypothetical protein